MITTRRKFLAGLVATAIVPKAFSFKRTISKTEIVAKPGLITALKVTEPGLFNVGDVIEIGGKIAVITKVGPNATVEVRA